MADDSVLEAIENMILMPKKYDHRKMEPLHVSNKGDDKHDGKTPLRAVSSLKRLRELFKINNTELRFADTTTKLRVLSEIEKEKASDSS